MNPLDFKGPEFLAFYVVAGAVSVIWWSIARHVARGPGGKPSPDELEALHPYEVAYLVGGAKGAVGAALATLVHRGWVEIKDGELLLTDKEPERELVADNVFRGFTAAKQAHELEEYIIERLKLPVLFTVSEIRQVTAPVADFLAPGLKSRGLLRVRTSPLAYIACTLPLLALLLLGVLKVGVGIVRERPVFFLMVLLGATVYLLVKLPSLSGRTRRGDRAVELMKQENAALVSTARSAPQQLTAPEAALAVALFGGLALGGALAGLETAFLAQPMVAKASSSQGAGTSCGSACGSSCGGGCGGGCGGCGGCG